MAVTCAAQDSTSAYIPTWRLFIEPLAILDPMSGSSLRLGAELPVGRDVSVIAVGGAYYRGYYCKAGFKHYGWADRFFWGMSGSWKDETHR